MTQLQAERLVSGIWRYLVSVDEIAWPSSFLNYRMAAVAVVTALFFAAIIIAMWQVVGVSSPNDVILMLLVGDAGSSLSGSLDGPDSSFDNSDVYAELQVNRAQLECVGHAKAGAHKCVESWRSFMKSIAWGG